MDHQLIRSAIIDLIRSGRLTADDGEIFLDSQPITIEASNEQGEYREDGWSHETSHGCRRHRAIDAKLDELRQGNEFEQKVAADGYRFFCFDTELEGFEAEDEDERDEADRARFNSRILARWLQSANGKDFPTQFRIKPGEKYAERATGYWFMPEDHAVVYPLEPEAKVTERWPQHYVEALDSQVEGLRQQANLNWR